MTQEKVIESTRPAATQPVFPLPLPLAGAFFASGAAALIYELLWFRLLGHVFGSTATATATLLAAYLFGLGLGAWLFGRLSDRITSITRMYVAIEAGIGIYGIASKFLLERGAILYALGHEWAGDHSGRLLLARFLISFLLIAIPTTLMGGTFPLMVQLLKVRAGSVGRAAGEAYAANTAGAAAGTLALPLLLLPALGVARSLIVAAAANLTAAVLVFRSRTETLREAAPVAADAGVTGRDAIGFLLAGFFLSSFAALALETVWARHFSLFFGSQIYNFAFILFSYLVGLFAGGTVFARLVARGTPPGRILQAGLALAGASVALTLPFLDRLPIPQIRMMLAIGVSHGSFLTTTAIETLAIILPTAFGFGLVFPAVVDLVARRSHRTGASVALAYVVNTAGTTLGAIGAGFFLIPAVGTQRTLEISVVLIASAFFLSAKTSDAPRRPLFRWGVPAVLFLVLLLPRWDWRLAHGTYAKDPLAFTNAYREKSLYPQIRQERVNYLVEGTEATVGVAQFDTTGYHTLFINGKPDASSHPADMVIQRLLAIVPGLFNDGPRDALVIGLGSGTTLATLMRYPLEHIDAAEISPEVADAARRYFGDVNENFLSDPRVRLHLEDGRNFMHFQPKESYDIIISAPSNPWLAGISSLFTDEFFREAAERLRPGGILCQWSGYYNLSLDHIRLVARTMERHFPETAIFVARGERPTGDFLLIGAKGPLRMRRLPDDPALPPRIRDALTEIGNDGPETLLSGLVVSPENARAFAGDGAINSDDRPALEVGAPGDRFHAWFFENLFGLLTASPRSFLAAGPTTDESPAAVEVARDGFALSNHPLPVGDERRGVFVLTSVNPQQQDVDRYVLLGREFVSGGGVTGLFRLARPPSSPGEVLDVAKALAGPGTSGVQEVGVNGHRAVAVLGEDATTRVAIVGWFCDVTGRGFFTMIRAPREALNSPTAVVSQLIDGYPCDHARPPGGR